MRLRTLTAITAIMLANLLTPLLPAQTGNIVTVAGNGTPGTFGVGGPAINASLMGGSICFDAAHNLYVTDSGNYRVVRIDAASSNLTLVGGTGAAGSTGDGGPAVLATLNAPRGLACDPAGNLYVAEFLGNRVRRIDAQSGIISTVAGTGVAGFGGDGGPASAAQFRLPFDVTLDSAGNLYIADAGNARVRRVDAATGIVSTFAGNGAAGVAPDGVAALAAPLAAPFGISFDNSGNLLITESGSARVRRVNAATGLLTTIAGNGGLTFTADGIPATSAAIGRVGGNVASDSAGNLFFADGTSRVRRVDAATGLIGTVAGSGAGAQGQTAGAAGGGPSCFTHPLGDGTPATSARMDGPFGVALAANGNLLLSDPLDCRIRRVDLPSPRTYTNTALSANVTSVGQGQPVLFTATVTPIGPGTVLSGSVVFFDQPLYTEATLLGTAPIVNGSAAISLSFPQAYAGHNILALYTGNGVFDASGSNEIPITVTPSPKVAPSVILISGQNPAQVNTPVTFTVTVTPPNGNVNQPSGSVYLYEGGTQLAMGTLSGGIVQIPVTFSTGGNHAIMADYDGDANFYQVISATVNQTVRSPGAISLTSNVNPSNPGATVTFTATVSPSTATGLVQFTDGGAVIGLTTVSAGQATLAVSNLMSGVHAIQASYGGDQFVTTAMSAILTQTVKQAAVISLVSSAPNSTYGQAVTLTATVTPSDATGTVRFLSEGATVLSTVAVTAGSASLTVSNFTAGGHTLTALYSGDSVYALAPAIAIPQNVAQATPTITVSTLNNPITVGQFVLFAISISPAPPSATVTVMDGSTVLGTAPVAANGAASFSTTTLLAGNRQISVTWVGDGNVAAGTSAVLTELVQSPTTISETASGTLIYGQPVTLTVHVSPAEAAGSINFNDAGTILGTVPLTAGTAVLTVPSFNAGNHLIAGTFISSDGVYFNNSATVSIDVAKIGATVALAASPNPSALTQAVTLTATVTPAAAPGQVEFYEGATLVGVGAISGGSATVYKSFMSAGTHSLTAVYAGALNYTNATSTAVSQTVKANSTTTVTGAGTSTYGQAVQLTATVSPAATGTVQFLDGSTSLGTATLTGSSAAITVSTLAVGAHSITAVYSGDASNSGSTSATVTQTVQKISTTVAVAASPNPSVAGQAVIFTATVAPSGATGTVQFLDGATSLGTATLSGSSVALTVSTLAVGAHSITAVYSGDANNSGSASAAVTQTIQKISATVAVAASPNPSVTAQAVIFTATVAPSSATGTVQFKDGATVLGTGSLTAGVASLSVSTLAAGTHSITAVYSGDANDTAAASSGLTQTVNQPLPGAPSNLTATATSSTQINLAWTASATSGVTYNVYSATTSGFTPSTANRIATGLTATNYAHTGLAASSTHYYVVTAQNAAGTSAASNQAAATTPAAGLSCHVGYSVTTQWNVGFGTAITIKNTGTKAISGWTLTWTWAGNQQITQAWNANYTQSGTNATLTNASWNGAIAAGATLTGMGFNASYSGTNTAPTAFYINGTLCQ